MRKALLSELREWKDLERERGFRLVIIFVPDVYQLDGNRRNLQADYYAIEQSRLDPLLPNRLLSDCLVDLEVPYIDPTEEMMGLPDIAECYFVHDNHFTVKGHVRFAEAIGDKIRHMIGMTTAEVDEGGAS